MAEAISDTVTITAPQLVGVWVFDPTEPGDTERNYLHADGRTEVIDVETAVLKVRGRGKPIIEYGEIESRGLKVTIFVPFGAEHDAAVEWWRAAMRNRRAICYRDNRGRLLFAGLNSSPSIADGRAGTAIGVSLIAVDYDEAA
jgi:hypothetical protein